MNWSMYARAWCALCLICSLIALETTAAGQASAGLRIIVLDGGGAQNQVSRAASKSISVRIVDRNNKPVPGATVIFTAPDSGPSGRFLNGSDSVIVFTNPQGIAMAQEFRANAATGPYLINIRAAYMNEVATASIPQTNVAQKKSNGKIIMIAAAAGGAAAAAFVAKGGGGGGGSTPNPSTPPGTSVPTITLAGSSVGAPR